MTKPFTLTEVRPKIFFLNFNNYYDMTMYLLRCQEFYESPSPKFRGKSFKIFDFMKWYSLKYGKGSFTYPMDWSGFNFPSSVMKEVYSSPIEDYNKYDEEMLLVYKEISKSYDDFYVIAAVGKNDALKLSLIHI